MTARRSNQVSARPAHVLQDSIDAVLAAAEAFEDPMVRARELALALGRIPEAQRRLRHARADALRAVLDSGATPSEVADELGVGLARLSQLLDD